MNVILGHNMVFIPCRIGINSYGPARLLRHCGHHMVFIPCRIGISSYGPARILRHCGHHITFILRGMVSALLNAA